MKPFFFFFLNIILVNTQHTSRMRYLTFLNEERNWKTIGKLNFFFTQTIFKVIDLVTNTHDHQLAQSVSCKMTRHHFSELDKFTLARNQIKPKPVTLPYYHICMCYSSFENLRNFFKIWSNLHFNPWWCLNKEIVK